MAPAIRTVAAAAALLLLAAAVGAPSGVAAAPAATPAPTPTPTPVPACSGSRCTAFGPGARCTLGSPKGDFITTCKAYAAYNGTCEGIASSCVTVDCVGSAVVAGSDGALYCNWCTLTAASCESGFKLYKVARETVVPTPPSPPAATPKTPAPTGRPVTPAEKPAAPAGPVAPGPDGCTPLAPGKAARQAFPPYSDLVCPEDFTLCERDADCGSAPGGKQMVCAKQPGCSPSRCSRMSVSADRQLCEGAGRCTRDCRRGQGVCTPIFC
eukprot:TRINITY_DN1902_c0_g1_i6.p1 TRINITY_DN1902_c0_g1~~TRINITY_DN1902_c0_g1_i6.p1  ORF type:complete len:297 (+),score=71.90 TRINITY_DN1902_c0_g1_i6:89-892(+)